jgi:tetratricopeptide (TPR) repeat protein
MRHRIIGQERSVEVSEIPAADARVGCWMVQRKGSIRWLWAAIFALWVLVAPGLRAQSGAQSQSAKPAATQQPSGDDNPFPGDAPQPAATPPAQQGSGQSGAQPASAPAQAPKGGDNPFPGEDTSVPLIPVAPSANARPDAGSGSAATPRREQDGDPVRSPDGPGHFADGADEGAGGSGDGFSSSLSGMDAAPAPDATDEQPGKPARNKSRSENTREDIDVGTFYLQQKNWRAAQARFASAYAADKENPDAVWGLAEAERHLRMYKEADEHYKLFLTYDPTGPHGKAARKALEEVDAELASSHAAQK